MTLCILTVSQKSHALTAHTINIIVGSKPKVVDITAAAKKHGFILNGVFYSSSTHNLSDTNINEFDGFTKLSDFIIKNYTANDLDNSSNYDDAEGDSISHSQPFAVGQTIYQWFDNNGIRIADSDKLNIIGCGSGYAMPLTLTITTSVKTYSEYGNPNESETVTITKLYKIASKSKLCYAKPYSTESKSGNQWVGINSADGYNWNDPNFSQPNPNNGGGYSVDYVPNWGYKANPAASSGKIFPTTGFSGAKFQLVMTGAQTDYEFSIPVNPGGNVSVDDQGYITLNDKPTGAVTINAKLIRDNNIVHQYTFDVTRMWVVPHNGKYTYNQAVQICNGQDNMLTMADLSNSPRSYDYYNLTSADHISNSYTRKIGDSVFGEWGWATKNSYPDSNWREDPIDTATFSGRYWTKEINKTDSQWGFVVHCHDGYVVSYSFRLIGSMYNSSYANVVCKK